MTKVDTNYYDGIWSEWDDMKTYGPMSRHVRRLVQTLIRPLKFKTVADIGCGVGTVLTDIKLTYPKAKLTGTELFGDSLEVAKKRLPNSNFYRLDLVQKKLPKKFDLTLCIDVFEHIQEDVKAMQNLLEMTKGHAVIVVPLGPLFAIETERVGHVNGYSRKEFDAKLESVGFEIVSRIQWGFPFYNLYRRLLHRLPESTTTGTYTWKKKLTSQILYWILSLNTNSPWGERYFVVCRPRKL